MLRREPLRENGGFVTEIIESLDGDCLDRQKSEGPS
jgi:hypothetical protein